MNNTVQQAIVTKYIGPSNGRGSRVKAFCAGGSITLNYADELNDRENARVAAEALRDRMGWTGELVQAGLPKGYVFAFMPKISGYRCKVCGMTGTDHDYEATYGINGHKFECGEPIY